MQKLIYKNIKWSNFNFRILLYSYLYFQSLQQISYTISKSSPWTTPTPVFYPRFIKSHRIRCAFSFIPYPSNPLRNISPVIKARFRGFSRVCVSSAFVPRGNPREFSWNSRIISGARDGVWTNFIHELRFQRSFLRKQEIRLARERAFLLV